jgi:hypothetical protein
MGRTTPPFRADHVGSLLRPRRLLQARHDHAAGRMSEEELRAVEDDAIHATASVFWQSLANGAQSGGRRCVVPGGAEGI